MAAKETIDKLSDDLNENCLLGVIHHDKRILVYSTTIDHDLSVRNKPERKVYETATGRLLLSYLDSDQLEAFLQREGLPSEDIWREASAWDRLLDELKKIKENEIVVTRTASHVVGVAVPVWKNETVVAALSTYLPESRYTTKTAPNIQRKLKEAAAAISENLKES